jgi:hypothetical protein
MIKINQTFIKNFWPTFHNHGQNSHLKSFYTFTDYWRLWVLSVLILIATALLPLCLVTIIHYQLIQKSVDSELNLRAERLSSNAVDCRDLIPRRCHDVLPVYGRGRPRQFLRYRGLSRQQSTALSYPLASGSPLVCLCFTQISLSGRN